MVRDQVGAVEKQNSCVVAASFRLRGGYFHSAVIPTLEEVTEPDGSLCKRGKPESWDRGVKSADMFNLFKFSCNAFLIAQAGFGGAVL